jgi:flagellin
VRDLAVQAGNDSNNEDSRAAITTEVTQLVDELTRISDTTNFNGIKLLDASAGAAGDGVLSFQVGADGAASSQITVNLASADIATLATDLKAAIVTTDGFADPTVAAATITTVDTAIKSVSSARADLGAVQNRFESTINSLQVSAENLSAAKSRIADTDMAAEMVKYTAANILQQAGTAMLAQANQSGQGVLQLLR